MNKYTVYVLEIHQVPIQVEAVSESDAIERALNCEGDWSHDDMHFVECCDTDVWTVELIEDGNKDEASK